MMVLLSQSINRISEIDRISQIDKKEPENKLRIT